MNINEEAIEAAARAVVQSLWNNDGHDYDLYVDFGNELTGIVDGEVSALALARAALEAAAPMLMAQAWDEGMKFARECADETTDSFGNLYRIDWQNRMDYEMGRNPYRRETP